MPSLKDTKRRIASVKSTQKITRAMKLVSSAKYARANRELLKSQPYRTAFSKLFEHMAYQGNQSSPLTAKRPEKRCLLIVLTTDRGLCGGLNSNLIKKTKAILQKKHADGVGVDLVLWGRRASMGFAQSGLKIFDQKLSVMDHPSFDLVKDYSNQFRSLFEAQTYDRIEIVYPAFVNVVSQVATQKTLYPVEAPQTAETFGVEPVVEPDRETLYEEVLSQHVTNILYGVIQEGAASEHAARMTAMDNATNNAEEVVRALTIQYNRARQAAITKELIEITSGAEAL